MNHVKDMTAKSEALRAQLRAKLGVKSTTLEQGLRRAGGRLPRRIRLRGNALLHAEALLRHPKLSRQVDGRTVTRAYAEITAHLDGINVADRRRGTQLQLAGLIVGNLLVVGTLFLGWLWWKGYV